MLESEGMAQKSGRPEHLGTIAVLMLVWQVLAPLPWLGHRLTWSVFVLMQVVGALLIWALWRGYFWIRWFMILGCVLSLPDILSIVQPNPLQTVARAINIVLSIFLLYWLNTSAVRSYYRRGSAPDLPKNGVQA